MTKKSSKILDQIRSLELKRTSLYKEYAGSFLSSRVTSFLINCEEDYNDNNYFKRLSLCEVNGVKLNEYLHNCSSADDLDYEIEDSPDSKAKLLDFLKEAKIKSDDLYALLSCIENLDAELYYEGEFEFSKSNLQRRTKTKKKAS